jgi:hypothetical protein
MIGIRGFDGEVCLPGVPAFSVEPLIAGPGQVGRFGGEVDTLGFEGSHGVPDGGGDGCGRRLEVVGGWGGECQVLAECCSVYSSVLIAPHELLERSTPGGWGRREGGRGGEGEGEGEGDVVEGYTLGQCQESVLGGDVQVHAWYGFSRPCEE